MSFDGIKKILKNEIDNIIIEENVPMSKYTSFRAGGSARMMVMPQSIDDLKTVLSVLGSESCRHMVLGNGSNVLVRDSGYDGIIVKIGSGFDYVRQEEDCLVC